ncbi:hypothetical protein [Candidatus Pristimantibacillus sp. PTI5]|uniref:hypothetical protein n=1 Tax=Candidatus Pristimantibacillus sp. PTI5 TaxID=3400422 RepID=UPI003B01BF23
MESTVSLPYFIEAHKSLGFKTVPNLFHTYYDGVTPTPTFVLDLQREKLLKRLLES